MRRSLSLLAGIAAAGLMTASPGVASACRVLAMPTESELIANIEQRQAEAWERSPLVYLAEVVEWRYVEGTPTLFGDHQVRLRPLVVLKGEASPEALMVTVVRHQCVGPFHVPGIEARAWVGDRFVIYATTPQPSSEDDIWSQAWLEVRDPTAIRALAERGWVQRGGWQERER